MNKKMTLRIWLTRGPEGVCYACALCGAQTITGGVDGFALDGDGNKLGYLCTSCRFGEEVEVRERIYQRMGDLRCLVNHLEILSSGRIEVTSRENYEEVASRVDATRQAALIAHQKILAARGERWDNENEDGFPGNLPF
jgi:hypothetical protein